MNGMNSNLSSPANEEMDMIVENFLYYIRQLFQPDEFTIKGLYATPIDFSITHISTESYNENTAAMRMLQSAVREHLINPLIYYMLQRNSELNFIDSDYISKRGTKKHYSIAKPLLDEYENRSMIEFVFRKKGQIRYDAVIYSDYNLTSQEFVRFCRYQLIKSIYWVDWNSEENDKSQISFQHPTRFTKKIFRITVAGFFEEFLPNEDYSAFLNRVRDAIKTAKDIIGFITIRALTPSYLHEFKKELKTNLDTYDLRGASYHWINDDSSITEESVQLLEQFTRSNASDMETIISNYKDHNKVLALIGTKGFAKCFVTSEYMRLIFQKGNQGIEYTAVVCGYLKAIEQLVYAFVKMLLSSGRFSNYHIEHGGNAICNQLLTQNQMNTIQNLRTIGRLRENQVPFQPEYEKVFKSTLSYIISFLERIRDAWNLSNSGKEYVCKLLYNFTRYCRNEHFHKDNITDKNYVETVRDNSIILALLLLGSMNMSISAETPEEILGINEEFYEQLVELLKTTRWPRIYYLKYGDDEYMVHRDYHKQIIQYDENGNQRSNEFEFVIVENRTEMLLEEAEYNQWYKSKRKILITKDNIPDYIWIEIKGTKERRQIWPPIDTTSSTASYQQQS